MRGQAAGSGSRANQSVHPIQVVTLLLPHLPVNKSFFQISTFVSQTQHRLEQNVMQFCQCNYCCSQEYEEHVQELERLRWVHEASQLQHITTVAWQAKQEAMLAALKFTNTRPGVLEVRIHIPQCACCAFEAHARCKTGRIVDSTMFDLHSSM